MCNCFDSRRWYDNGRTEFLRGDLKAREGIRKLDNAYYDIECGIQDMERGMGIAQCQNTRNNDCGISRNDFCRYYGYGCGNACHLPGFRNGRYPEFF